MLFLANLSAIWGIQSALHGINYTNGSNTGSLEIDGVTVKQTPAITTPGGALTGATVDVPYSETLAVTNSPNSWTITGGTALPDGLSIRHAGASFNLYSDANMLFVLGYLFRPYLFRLRCIVCIQRVD